MIYLKYIGVWEHMHIHTYFSTVFFYNLCIFVLLSDQSYEATLNSSALCSIPLECLTSSHSRCFVPACVLSNQGGFPGQFLSFSHHSHVSLPDSAQFEPETYEFLQCLSGYIFVSRNYPYAVMYVTIYILWDETEASLWHNLR